MTKRRLGLLWMLRIDGELITKGGIFWHIYIVGVHLEPNSSRLLSTSPSRGTLILSALEFALGKSQAKPSAPAFAFAAIADHCMICFYGYLQSRNGFNTSRFEPPTPSFHFEHTYD